MGRKIILLVFGIAVLLLILFVLCGELKPLPAALGGGLLLLFDPLNSRLKNSSLLFRALWQRVHIVCLCFLTCFPQVCCIPIAVSAGCLLLPFGRRCVFRHCCILKCSTALIKVRKAGDKCEIYYIKA